MPALNFLLFKYAKHVRLVLVGSSILDPTIMFMISNIAYHKHDCFDHVILTIDI